MLIKRETFMTRDRLDPRVVRTRQMLREAFMALIAERGFEAATIQDITERATLNRATFYLHYRDKYELLTDLFETLIGDITPMPPEDASLQSPYDVVPGVARVFEHFAEHADFYRSLLGSQGVLAFTTRIRDYIEEVGRKWLDAPTSSTESMVHREIAINYLASAYLGVLTWWLEHDMPYTSEEMAMQLMHLTAAGLHRSLGMQMQGGQPETYPLKGDL
jgi:AcrR family transcriptional regulator